MDQSVDKKYCYIMRYSDRLYTQLMLGWLFIMYSLELQLVHIIDEVWKSHEGWSLILRQIGTDSTWISTSSGIKKDTELVIIDFFWTASNLPQKLFHIYGEFEFGLNDLDKGIFWYGTLFICLSSQSHKGI